MSFISKLVALSFLSGALAATERLGVARRQVAATESEVALKFSPSSGWSAPVKIGADTFNLVISTQDADTWVAADNIKCVNPPDAPPSAPQPPCKFGNKYKTSGTFAKATGDQGPVLNGVIGSGLVGSETVTVAGITVPKQTIGVLNDGAGFDETVSGSLGLGPSIQTDIGYLNNQSRFQYSPIFDSMVQNKLIKSPVFSLALTATGGALAFGGLPKSVSVDAGSLATAQLAGEAYAITADGYLSDGKNVPASLSLLIDLASPGIYFPKTVADAINSKIPGSKFRTSDGLYSVPCDTKVSGAAGVVIGGKAFGFSELTMKDPDVPSGCLSLVGAYNSTTDGVLGVPFLKSVVTIFDPTNRRIQFMKKK
jgi:Eukaryotic aspartyl protease